MAYLNRYERRLIYIDGLKNAHAMETQAIQLLGRQVDRLQHYPEMETRLRLHIDESKTQRNRIEQLLGPYSEASNSGSPTLKAMVLGIGGNLTAAVHAPASDEVLKNAFANFAYEHFEMAAYKSLIAMAESLGDGQGAAAAAANLAEEAAMAAWIDEHITPTTLTVLDRSYAGITASV